MAKKIIFIDHTPFPGGAQLVLGEHIRVIDKTKYECVVICSHDTPLLVDIYKRVGARVITIDFSQLKTRNPSSFVRFYRTVRDLIRIFRIEHPDLIVTNTVRAHLVGTLAAKKSHLPVVWIIRDYTFPRALFKLLYPFVSKVLTVSRNLLDYYRIAENRKNHVIFVGTDMAEDVAKVTSSQVQKLRKELGIDSHSFVVGYVGRLVAWKGAQVIVDAVKDLSKRNKDIVAVIVGDGKGQEDTNEVEIQKSAKGFEKTIILTGWRAPEEIPVFLKMFDCFVHSSLEPEPFATVVVAAMMARLPVIGTTIGGTPELITDHKNGILVQPNDSNRLGAAIMELYSQPKLRSEINQAGYTSVYPDLTEKNVTKKVVEYYDEVLS